MSTQEKMLDYIFDNTCHLDIQAQKELLVKLRNRPNWKIYVFNSSDGVRIDLDKIAETEPPEFIDELYNFILKNND